jgi:regulator of sigma D
MFDVSVRLSIALVDRRLKNRQQYTSCVGIDGPDQLFNDLIPRTVSEVIADDYLSENHFNEFTNRIKRSEAQQNVAKCAFLAPLA